MDPTEPTWDLRRGAKFEPPPGWSVVEGSPEGEGAWALPSPRETISKDSTPDFSHLDGLTYFWYGNWFPPDSPEGWRIITTPNSTWIPFPYLLYRDVHLRQDGFLGREDPILLPQLYNDSLPHLACISLSGPENSDVRFFRERIDVEFIDPPTSFPRRCGPSEAAKSRCRTVWNHLKLKYTTFVTQHGKDRHKRLSVITSQFEIGSASVARFQGMYLELTFRFAILCRLYLEIEAYYHHHELSEAHEFSMDARSVDGSLVGTITTDETVCYRFHRMGVPVWLNRRLAPNSGVPCRLISERIPLNPDFRRASPNGVSTVVARVPSVRPIFEGPCNDAGYLVRIADWVRDCFRTELGDDHPIRPFFASYQRKPRPPRENRPGTSKKRKTNGSEDGETSKRAKKRKNRATEGMCGDRVPHIHSVLIHLKNRVRCDGWRAAGRFGVLSHRALFTLAHFTADLKQLLEYAALKPSSAWETVGEELEPEPKPSLRLAPPLDVFTGVDNVLQLKRFVYVWLKIKGRWLAKVGEELQPPEFANRRAWRTFMRGSFDPTPIKPESEAGKSRLRFTDYLGLSEPPKYDINNTRLNLNPLRPLDKTVDDFTVRNALHELNEINFLHDIYEVELRRTWDLPSVIVDRLRHVAGDDGAPFANLKPFSRRSVPERLRWIVALRDIVKEWPTSLPKPREFDLEPRTTARGPRVEDLLALELAVARRYLHVTGEILDRRPTIPLYR